MTDNNSISRDIEQGAKKSAEIAKTAVQAGKAIGKAATGDLAGAAKDVVQSEGLRTIVAVLLIMSFLLTIMLFFAAPLALYEGVKAYFDTIKERWLEEYYGSDSGRVLAALKATVTGAWDIIKDFWSFATSGITQNADGSADTDAISEKDMSVFGLQDSLSEVYARKMDACIDKIGSRQKMIEGAIQASANGSIYDTGTVNGWIYNNLFCARDVVPYVSRADTRQIYYGGVTVTSGSRNMTRREAMKVIALYSAMYNCSAELIKPYSLMKWLGYYDGSAGYTSFIVGDAVSCAVKGWRGEFMPMYLVEESLDNPEGDYSSYMAPAADVLLTVSCEPLASLIPHIEMTEVRRTEYEQKTGYGPQWRLMSASTYASWSSSRYTNPLSQADSRPTITFKTQLMNYYRGNLSYEGVLDAYNSGLLSWYIVDDYYSYWGSKEIIEYNYTISYTLNVSVGLRSADTIAKLAGFYEREPIEVPKSGDSEDFD